MLLKLKLNEILHAVKINRQLMTWKDNKYGEDQNRSFNSHFILFVGL
jgi:hypothetical protein